MTQLPRINIAIIGIGHVGPRHAQSVVKCTDANLVCFVDPSPQAEKIVKTFQCPLFKSVQEMLEGRSRPDAAIACTPNSTHVDVARELLLAGIDVLVEKPISTTVSSGLELLDVARQTGTKLLVGHHRRFNPYIVAAKQALSDGTIGRPIAVSGLWVAYKPASYFEAPTEWRATVGNGPIIRVHAEQTTSQRGHEAEEGAAILLRFASGVVGTFVVSDATPSPHFFESASGENPIVPKYGKDVYRIFGTKGTLSVGDCIITRYEAAVEKSWSSPLCETKLPVGSEVPFDEQVEHFVRVARGIEQPRCTGEDGLSAVIVCDAVKRAMTEGTAVDIDFSKR